MALALIPLASPYHAPLISLVGDFEPAKGSALIRVLAILLIRLVGGGLFGIAIGYLQARGLSKFLGADRGWVIACSASYSLGDVAHPLLVGRIQSFLGSAFPAIDPVISGTPAEPILAPMAILVSFVGVSFFFGATYGLVIAVPQWIYLRRKILRAWRWLAIYPAALSLALGIAFAGGWLVAILLFVGTQLEESLVLGVLYVASLLFWPIPAALLSGVGMVAIARIPRPKAVEVTGGLGNSAP
jgi:hypothetical protein